MALWDQSIRYGTGCNFRPPGVQGPVLSKTKRKGPLPNQAYYQLSLRRDGIRRTQLHLQQGGEQLRFFKIIPQYQFNSSKRLPRLQKIIILGSLNQNCLPYSRFCKSHVFFIRNPIKNLISLYQLVLLSSNLVWVSFLTRENRW